MTSFDGMIQQSSLAWLMLTGLLLGGLHALEPGHAKTMMASFIVATRGSVKQAVLLGMSAALSHSALIWVLAAVALYTGNAFIGDDAEPWLQLGSGLVIVAIGVSMAWRHARSQVMVADRDPMRDHGHHHDHGHDHDHDHDHSHGHDHVHGHDHGHGHEHRHGATERHGHSRDDGHHHVAPMDAHARAHARQIARRLDGRPVTTRQIVLFGLSGGLMPCPAALTMLLVCLRLKKTALGVALVTSFSLGLAVVLVGLGVMASIGLRHASRRLPSFERAAEWLPYVSSFIVVSVGLFMAVSGYTHLV